PFFALALVKILNRMKVESSGEKRLPEEGVSRRWPQNLFRSPGLWLGVTLLLAAYTELTYATMLPVFGLLYGVFRLRGALLRPATWREIGPPLLLGAGVFAAGLAPFLRL